MRIQMTSSDQRWFGKPQRSRRQCKLPRVTPPPSGQISSGGTCRAEAPRRRKQSEGGMATVLFIALLAIMMVFITVETSSIIRLHREVKLLEQQQVKRLGDSQTNAVSTAIKP